MGKQTNNQGADAAALAETLTEVAQRSGDIVQRTVQAMKEIDESSEKISESPLYVLYVCVVNKDLKTTQPWRSRRNKSKVKKTIR